MWIALSDPRTRFSFVSLVTLIFAALSYSAAKSCLAAAWNSSPSPERWESAARLEPGNAAYLEKLGLYREWDLDHRDLEEAGKYLGRSVQLDPLSPQYRLELASIEESRGELSKTRDDYEAAKLDYPVSAEVAWRYGSFLLRQGDTASGYAEIRSALESDPDLEAPALAECWAADPDPNLVVRQALPATSAAYLTALDFFVSLHLTVAAGVAWSQLINLGKPFPMARALPLVNQLISDDRLDEAKNVWDKSLLATQWPRSSLPAESLIFNGGFENGLLEGGFDWRELPARGASFGMDLGVAHSGSRSLRIDFDGNENIDFRHLYEYVMVQPGHRYRFSAFLRTEDISTDSGLRFEIVDPLHPAELQSLTYDLTGTQSSTQVETELQAPANTHLIEIILRRLQSKKLDNKIRGTAWLDDAALTPINPKSARNGN